MELYEKYLMERNPESTSTTSKEQLLVNFLESGIKTYRNLEKIRISGELGDYKAFANAYEVVLKFIKRGYKR
jgi:hypothetical protein